MLTYWGLPVVLMQMPYDDTIVTSNAMVIEHLVYPDTLPEFENDN